MVVGLDDVDDVLIDDVMVGSTVEVGGLVLLVDEVFTDDFEDELELPQVPPTSWQPVPQYTSVEPQYPYWLQQFPKVDPRQVILAEHDPSVLTTGGVVPPLPPDPERYQFATGSPRHSPTVTDL